MGPARGSTDKGWGGLSLCGAYIVCCFWGHGIWQRIKAQTLSELAMLERTTHGPWLWDSVACTGGSNGAGIALLRGSMYRGAWKKSSLSSTMWMCLSVPEQQLVPFHSTEQRVLLDLKLSPVAACDMQIFRGIWDREMYNVLFPFYNMWSHGQNHTVCSWCFVFPELPWIVIVTAARSPVPC